MVFIGITYNINCLFLIIKTIFFGYVSGFFTIRFFNNMNVMFIEDFYQFMIIRITLLLRLSIVSKFFKCLLFDRKGLIIFQKFLFVTMLPFAILLKKFLTQILRIATRLFLCFLYNFSFSSLMVFYKTYFLISFFYIQLCGILQS